MPALIYEPYLPIDGLSETPVWVLVEVAPGAGEKIATGDVVTVELSAVVDEAKEFASTERTGLPYTFEVGDKAEEPLVKAVTGMREGGERYVSRRGLLLAVGNIQPAASELKMQIRIVKVERRAPRKGR